MNVFELLLLFNLRSDCRRSFFYGNKVSSNVLHFISNRPSVILIKSFGLSLRTNLPLKLADTILFGKSYLVILVVNLFVMTTQTILLKLQMDDLI